MAHTAEHDRMASLIADLMQGGAPRLARLAARTGRSPFYLQRSFRRWVGLSPRQFSAFARVSRAKGLLAAAGSVLDVALEVGLSGPGRLHDHFVHIEAMSPGESKAGGAGVTVRFGHGATPLGMAVVAWTPRGICHLAFIVNGDGLERVRREWPRADLVRDDVAAAVLLARVFAVEGVGGPLPLLVRGTGFQVAVWRALLEIPEGEVQSYAGLASVIGRAGAERAVGQAVGANPIAYLIPCHRVVRATGVLGGYAWGLERKAGLLARELTHRTESL